LTVFGWRFVAANRWRNAGAFSFFYYRLIALATTVEVNTGDNQHPKKQQQPT
jgi:hypothetical protein